MRHQIDWKITAVSPWRAVLGLWLVFGLAMACSGDPEVDDPLTTEPCGGFCPPDQCIFNQCQGPPDTPDVGMDAEDEVEDEQPPPDGCAGDDECEDAQYCDLDAGECAEGCRIDPDNCGDGQSCDADSRQCEDTDEPECQDDDACPEGQICDDTEGACVAGCRQNEDCAPLGNNLICLDNRCAGASCDDNNPCPGGQFCDPDLERCVPGCTDNDQCPTGQYCDQNQEICLEGCRDDDSCDEGESCQTLTVQGEDRQRCLPSPCTEDAGCPEAFYCDIPEGGSEGTCDEGCREGACPEGQICDLEERECLEPDCDDSNQCDDGFYCDLDRERSACVPGCDDDDQCARGQSCDLDSNACTCEGEEDCADGQVCFSNLCVPACRSNNDCPEGFGCNRQSGLCEDGCVDDDEEPNDDIAQAIPVVEGDFELSMCYGAFEGIEQSDCFAVDLSFDEILRVRVEFEHDEGNLDMRLFDPGDNIVEFSQTQSDLEEVVHQALLTGTYVFCVDPTGQDPFAVDYNLSVDVQEALLPCLEDFNEAEGDNTCPAALAHPEVLSLNEPTLLEGRSICEGDNDYFAVNLRAGQILRATLTRTDGAADIDAEVVGNDCDQVLAQTENFGPIRDLEFSVDADGTYYVRVFAPDPIETADYELSLLLEAGQFQCAEDVLNGVLIEPNDNSDQAVITEIQRFETYEVNDLYVCVDDADFYAVRVDVPLDYIRATLEQNDQEPPLQVAIIDQDGNTLLAENRDQIAIKEAETSPLAEPGVYYVRVSGVDGDFPETGVPYNLDILLTTDDLCLADGFEPNNNFGEAALIGGGQTNAVMCRDNAQEKDIYRIPLNRGDTVSITIEYDHSVIAPAQQIPALLYGPGEVDARDFTIPDPLAGADSFLNNGFVVTNEEAGMWMLEVLTGGVGPNLDYTINVDIVSPNCDEQEVLELFEPNESCGEAENISLDQQVDGFICGPTEDEDFFVVGAPAGQEMTIRAEYFHFDGNLDMEIYDGENSVFIDGSFNNGPNFEEVVIPNTDGGTYCIRIFTPGGLTQNDYSLEVTAQ